MTANSTDTRLFCSLRKSLAAAPPLRDLTRRPSADPRR